MKILFYSTNSNIFQEETYFITNLPSNLSKFQNLCKKYPDDSFYAITQKPGMFLADLPYQTEEKLQNQQNIFFFESDDTQEFADYIQTFNPDIVICASFWTKPYDWLPMKDSLIAENLLKKGIITFCHPLNTSLLCFDKFKTHIFLEKYNFCVPKAVYIQHDLFFCADNRREIKSNVYKESILSEIQKLQLPLIIKSTTGLSSYGMQVLNTYGEVKNYLNSKKNNGDRIIEEYVDGLQFGTEIYGYKGNYKIFSPFLFSTNQYGITSPKQSIKIGPISSNTEIKSELITEKNLKELYEQLLQLAEKLNLCGCAQIDLILKNNKWFIIEINPRLSGMTCSYEASFNTTFTEMLLLRSDFMEKNKVLNIKTKILSQDELKKLTEYKFIHKISQTEDKAAKQEREKGFCELIITGKSYETLLQNLLLIQFENPDLLEEDFVKKACNMINDIKK